MDIKSYILSKNYTDKRIEQAEMGDIELDASLSKAGQAADSKAVGDALKNIKMPEIDTTLTKEGAAADAKAVGEALANIDIPEGSGEQVQADWEQNDPNAIDYIKNKPFWTKNKIIPLFAPQKIRFPFDEMDNMWITQIVINDCPIDQNVVGQEVTAIIDDVEYKTTITATDESFGFSILDYNFTLYSDKTAIDYYGPANLDTFTHYATIQLLLSIEQIKKIDLKFINYTDIIEEDNSKLITSGAVAVALANINIPEGDGEQVQVDWNQADDSQLDYIKNKPFYEYGIERLIVDNQRAINYPEEMIFEANLTMVEGTFPVNAGQQVRVVVDGISYQTTVRSQGSNRLVATVNELGYDLTFMPEGYVELYAVDVKIDIFVSVYVVDIQIVKLDNKFIDMTNKLDIADPRPIAGSVVAAAIENLQDSVQGAQPDWNQMDDTAPDYIKNKPFGVAEDVKVCNTNLTWNVYEEDMSMYSSWTCETSFYGGVAPSITEGIYLVSFNGRSQTVELQGSEGIIETNFITLKYYFDRYALGWQGSNHFEIISSAPWGEDGDHSSNLVIIKMNVTKIDSMYLPSKLVEVDWNVNDENASGYIKNRTHYGTLTRVDYVEEERLSFYFDDMEYRWSMASMPIINKPNYNSSVIVVINGSDYECDVEERWDVKWDPVREDDIDYNYRYIQCGDYEIYENPDENVYMVKYNGEPDWDTYNHYATIEIYTQEGEIKQLDDMYIPDTIARKIDLLELDQSLSVAGYAADARAVGNMFRNNPVVQSDWEQTDNNQMDYIKHKPFGYEADYENQATATLSWTAIDYDMDSVVNWNEQNYIHVYAPNEYLPAGLYQISFYGNSEYVELTNDSYQGGTVKTKSITFEYFDEMGVYINILSNPPSWNTEGDILTITPVQLKKIDKDFIDISKSVNADDNRPITSAAVAEALANIGDNPNAPSGGDSAEQVQADWNETDSANPAYIKNKPFGIISGEPKVNAELSWSLTVEDSEMGTETCSWDMNSVNKIGTFEGGQYVVSFNGNSAVVDLPETSGTIKTDFIEISYRYDMWGSLTIFTINSDPPTWGNGSSQLIIAPAEIKKLDSIYVDGSQSDWNEADPNNAGYIQNKPFGKELGEACIDMSLEWYSYEQDMDTYYAWNNSSFNVYRYLAPGTYQLTFDNNSANVAITNSYSGRIETNFITLEYNWDDMDGYAQFRVVSNAPQIWEYNSAKLTLAPITFTTLDLDYLPNGIVDWNENDESKASYIKNRTHWDTQTTEWKQVAYRLGQVSYDDMGEAQYTKFTSIDVNVPINYNSDYKIITANSKWDAPSQLASNDGTIVQSYDYGMGDYAIVYNGTTYYDNIGTMTFENGITGIAIYERQIIAPMKQLDEKFIPDTIARAVVASETVLGGVKPVSKTEDMTQSVGIDANGQLWTTSSIGGNGSGEGGNAGIFTYTATAEQEVNGFTFTLPVVLKNFNILNFRIVTEDGIADSMALYCKQGNTNYKNLGTLSSGTKSANIFCIRSGSEFFCSLSKSTQWVGKAPPQMLSEGTAQALAATDKQAFTLYSNTDGIMFPVNTTLEIWGVYQL